MNQAGDAPMVGAPRRWDFLAGLMTELGLKSFVEVGCREGRTTGHILKSVPDATAIAIDPWAVQPRGDDPKRETYENWDFAEIERDFWVNVGEHKDRCEMLRVTSLEAAQRVTEPVDVVFIDALHDRASVDADIKAWEPLVRPGGVLAFHDYNHKWPGVERAIADHFNLMHVGLGPDSVAFVVIGPGVRKDELA